MELQDFYVAKLKLAWDIYNKTKFSKQWESIVNNEDQLLEQVAVIKKIYENLPQPG